MVNSNINNSWSSRLGLEDKMKKLLEWAYNLGIRHERRRIENGLMRELAACRFSIGGDKEYIRLQQRVYGIIDAMLKRKVTDGYDYRSIIHPGDGND